MFSSFLKLNVFCIIDFVINMTILIYKFNKEILVFNHKDGSSLNGSSVAAVYLHVQLHGRNEYN